ncbi:MAG: hypothetical protein AAGI72_01615 [Pseudomonadota bacterium]
MRIRLRHSIILNKTRHITWFSKHPDLAAFKRYGMFAAGLGALFENSEQPKAVYASWTTQRTQRSKSERPSGVGILSLVHFKALHSKPFPTYSLMSAFSNRP